MVPFSKTPGSECWPHIWRDLCRNCFFMQMNLSIILRKKDRNNLSEIMDQFLPWSFSLLRALKQIVHSSLKQTLRRSTKAQRLARSLASIWVVCFLYSAFLILSYILGTAIANLHRSHESSEAKIQACCQSAMARTWHVSMWVLPPRRLWNAGFVHQAKAKILWQYLLVLIWKIAHAFWHPIN